MLTTHVDATFGQALRHLDAGALSEAHSLFERLDDGPSPEADAARLGRLACLALEANWDAVVQATDTPPEPAHGALPLALRAVALAMREPSEEALRTALEVAYRPRRPLPLQTAVGAVALGQWFEERGHLVLQRATDAATDQEESPDPFRRALLALVTPTTGRARQELHAAVEGGLDLPVVLAALARLQRRDGDHSACRATLDRAARGEVEADLKERIEREREACARDAELSHALRAVLRQGDAERVLRLDAGLYLTLEEADGTRRWVSQIRDQAPADAMRDLVNDHLDAGWTLTDWTLEATDDDLDRSLQRAQSDSKHVQALRAGRRLMQRRPEDASLAARLLPSSVALRGYGGSLELSQRILALGGEPSWALRQHAGLLYRAGHLQECLGCLWYLEAAYGPVGLGPEGFALLARAHLLPRFQPSVASALIAQGEALHPDHPALREVSALLALWRGDAAGALARIQPLLDAPHATPAQYVIALHAHLEGELEGRQKTNRIARERWPNHPLVAALHHEIDGRTGPALQAYRAAMSEEPGSMPALEAQLFALRAAYRISAFEEGLKLARDAQTRLGEPDPRCLDVIYECLTALEPGEERDDLADMAAEARRRAEARGTDPRTRIEAILSAGLYLDPAALEPFWADWSPAPKADAKVKPDFADALVCCATESGCVTVFDAETLGSRLTTPPWDWYADEAALQAELDAHRVAVAPVDRPGVVWIRLTARPLRDTERTRYTELCRGRLEVASGQLYVGPGEALCSNPDSAIAPAALAQELGGCHRLIPAGTYPVRVYRRTPEPWPLDDVNADPCDVILRFS